MIKMNNFKDILCLSGNKKEHPLDQWVFLKGGHLIWPSANNKKCFFILNKRIFLVFSFEEYF